MGDVVKLSCYGVGERAEATFEEVLVVRTVNLLDEFYLQAGHQFARDVRCIDALADYESGAGEIEDGHSGDGDRQGVWQPEIFGAVGQESVQAGVSGLGPSEDRQDHSDADSLEEGGEYQQDDPHEHTPPDHGVEIANEVDEFVQGVPPKRMDSVDCSCLRCDIRILSCPSPEGTGNCGHRIRNVAVSCIGRRPSSRR